MTEKERRYSEAIERIDQANAEHPPTLQYARRMTAWLEQLVPDASDELRIAVRAQHLLRWQFPRDRFPMTRAGYHQWRTAAGRFHAEEVGRILREVGYDERAIARVQSLVRKEGLKSDPETQALEDSTCLAFLEQDFADFAAKHDDEKVIGIVQRTWSKMSPPGRQAALTLVLPEKARRLIERALKQAPADSTGP